LLIAALIAVPLSAGLQGLHALERPLGELLQPEPWRSGLETSYGRAAIATAGALTCALFSLATESSRVARCLALAGVLALGVALALTGHASTSEPWLIGRAALFVHGACVAFWIGSLLPLYASIRAHPTGSSELRRFSHAIPLALALMLLSGGWLALVQLGRLDALWTTSYGQVLACKLAAWRSCWGVGRPTVFGSCRLSASRMVRPPACSPPRWHSSLAWGS
jgi:copper transport protein